LNRYGIANDIVIVGDLQRFALRKMAADLSIELFNANEITFSATDRYIIVDGCKGNENVTDLPGEEIAVVDHHAVARPDDVPFLDIRSDVGASSSIVYSYYRDLGIGVPENAATALLIGLNIDTATMTRGVASLDLEAFSALYLAANTEQVYKTIRNNIKTDDLSYYKYAIENLQIYNRFAFCYFPQGCNQNLLGIMGDFFLELAEVDFVALVAYNDGTLNFSVRSEKKNWDASVIIKRVLKELGAGGGHMQMAGGIIRDMVKPNISHIYNRFVKALRLK
jgi:nanoRNase/pAp phosphatase (c-di-AMP/oligoRNAs hydrolase)